MLCLKWFNTPLIGKTEKLAVNEQPEGPIMDMPDLVMRKIMENIDFITMLKLRKVCHAFRNFIDIVKLDNDLTKVFIKVTPSAIYAFLNFASAPRKSANFYYIRYGNNCLLKIQEGRIEEAKLIKNQHFVDEFFNDFGFILRNKTKQLEKMNIETLSFDWYIPNHYDRDVMNSHRATYSIYGCCTSSRPLRYTFEAENHLKKINNKYKLQPTADKFHDRFDCILKSRKSPISIQKLEMRVLRPSYFFIMVRLIDMKQLRKIVIGKTYGESDEENGKQLVWDEIVELNVFKYIQELSITGFKVTVPLDTFLHIPDLTVSISTLTIEDVLLIKKNMITSPTVKSRCVYYDRIKDSDTLHNTLGHASSDYGKISWYFKLPGLDQILQISREYHETCFSFTWTKTSCIYNNAVVY